jgi:hypothetical protein
MHPQSSLTVKSDMRAEPGVGPRGAVDDAYRSVSHPLSLSRLPTEFPKEPILLCNSTVASNNMQMSIYPPLTEFIPEKRARMIILNRNLPFQLDKHYYRRNYNESCNITSKKRFGESLIRCKKSNQ